MESLDPVSACVKRIRLTGPLMGLLRYKSCYVSELPRLLTNATKCNGMSLAVLQRSKGRTSSQRHIMAPSRNG